MGIDLNNYDCEDGVFSAKKSKMPEVIDKIEKTKRIEELVNGIEDLPLGIDFTSWKIVRITKILKIMNGLE